MVVTSPFASVDRQAVLGTLRATGSRDPDVLHAHMKTLLSKVQLPKLLGIPLLLIGGLLIATVRWAFLGVPLVGVGWWMRRRGVINVATVEAAYHEFLTSAS